MKLATALAERSDIQNRINTISVRLDNNAKECRRAMFLRKTKGSYGGA